MFFGHLTDTVYVFPIKSFKTSINEIHTGIQVYVPQNITVPQNTSFCISLIKFEGNMLYTFL